MPAAAVIDAAPPLVRRAPAALKRTMDVALAVPLLALALPVIALAAVAIRLADCGPAFYSQVRLGRDGRPFRLWKLRTMVPNAERVLARRLTADDAVKAEWAATCKLADDPRILPGIGHMLRRYAIDEVPQLWNVLRGDLSLVGPRPLPPYHLNALDAGTRTLRRGVRPGLTGLWQVARRDRSLGEMARLDAAYVRSWTPLLDVWLLLRTIVVLSGGRHCL
ncbi:Undecaprenyl-phosphate galactose phosphotransferase [Caenispirillum salinarum AK4]|uniref:Undecaprenyl-phosphate galactose phosphotransferase n=1 Tax=Caenispirillum salinarum AK4 TaxID=1238182 RepID=K9GXQ3_9PROT|nr:Undecaprenyl-phosphate galactose phosphotransferase [Caenispirillum salinarum AK4]